MLIGGRFLLSFFATWATSSAPLYLVEITPAAYRGTIAGLYNTFYYVVGLTITMSCRLRILTKILYRRALCLPPQLYMHAISTLGPTGTWTGEFRSGYKWSALVLLSSVSSSSQNLRVGKSSPHSQIIKTSAVDIHTA
jgi:hypothetical protein